MLFQTNVCVWALSFIKLFSAIVMNGLTDNLIFLGDSLTLSEIELADGEDIFVWNGVEVRKYQRSTSW